MSPRKVLLLGVGPLPAERPERLGFPQLRTRQLWTALRDAGHEVRHADPGDATELDPVRALRRQWSPDAVVTAGPFAPMAAGPRVAGDVPLWIDVPGDPMSEAQLRAYRAGDDGPLRTYHQVLVEALARGDRFGAVSQPQRAALLGALGLAGRLRGIDLGRDPVDVVPISLDGVAAETGDDGPPPGLSDLPADAFVVLLAGGFNTWLDVDTLWSGVAAAMDRDARVRLLVVGGGIPGHEEQRYLRFLRAVRISPHAARVHALGWVPTGALAAVFRAAHLLLSIDLACHEAELGSRTRLLDALERGVPCAATVCCELTYQLSAVREFHPLAIGDAEGLTALLLRLARNHRRGRPAIRPARGTTRWSEAREAHTLAATTAPLLRWLERPVRAASPALDLDAAHAAEAAALRQELHRIWRTPTWRVLGRLHRLVKKTGETSD